MQLLNDVEMFPSDLDFFNDPIFTDELPISQPLVSINDVELTDSQLATFASQFDLPETLQSDLLNDSFTGK